MALSANRANPSLVKGAPAEIGAPGWPGLRILCADDNDKNQRIVELLLGKLGLDVPLCASGSEALDICAIHVFDLILIDIVMPDMDGMEALRRLRLEPNCLARETPAIALTAKLASDDIAAYMAAGFAGVATKPINFIDLASEISRVFATPARIDA
jgi:CheY-like chemotaxis protein